MVNKWKDYTPEEQEELSDLLQRLGSMSEAWGELPYSDDWEELVITAASIINAVTWRTQIATGPQPERRPLVCVDCGQPITGAVDVTLFDGEFIVMCRECADAIR